MNIALFASAASFAESPAELIVLIATTMILSLRVWIGVTGVTIKRSAHYLLTSLSIALIIIFVILVMFRFETLG
jgi:hypothetical protein